jgi:hypothetical protein
MPVSTFDACASNLSTHSAIEAYTHAMQIHTLSQISSLGLSENQETSGRDFDDVTTSDVPYQGLNAAETAEAARQAANGAKYTQA